MYSPYLPYDLNPHKIFPANLVGKDFVVGDLHGCAAELKEALVAINFNKETDRLFSVGDLTDRGPDSLGAITLLNEPWFHAVRGNHEQLFIDMMKNSNRSAQEQAAGTLAAHGGMWAFEFIQAKGEEAATQLADMLSELPILISIKGKYVDWYTAHIVHAQLSFRDLARPVTDEDITNWNFRTEDTDCLLWGRDVVYDPHPFLHLHTDLSAPVYVGHTPVSRAFQCPTTNHIFIDTGATYHHYGNDKWNSHLEEHKLSIAVLGENLVYEFGMRSKTCTTRSL